MFQLILKNEIYLLKIYMKNRINIEMLYEHIILIYREIFHVNYDV